MLALLLSTLGAADGTPSGFSPPVITKYVEPLPPGGASADGVVRLRLTVDETGLVWRVEVVATPDAGLAEAAAHAAAQFEFRPALLEGEPVPVVIDYDIAFERHGAASTSGAEAEPAPPAGYETVIKSRRIRREVDRLPVTIDVTPTVSRYTLTRRDIEITPGSLEDVARAVQSMPGVVGDPGLLATFFVRGGDSDEVVFYLDGVPLTNAFHLGGFASLFNPELIESIDLYAGAAPASYRSRLSGVLDIGYVKGDPELHDGMVDVSAHTAKTTLSGPTPIEGLTYLVAARRSYFEAYFEVLQALGVVGQGLTAPNIGEYYGKLHYTHGAHAVSLSLLHATDGLHFRSRQDEEALIKFEGELRIDNSLTLVANRWAWAPSARLTVRSLTAFMHDVSETTRRGGAADGVSGALVSSADARVDDWLARLEADVSPFDGNLVRLGVEGFSRRHEFTGRVEDDRTQPTWASTPLADYHLPAADIEPERSTRELHLFIEDEHRDVVPGLTPRAGLRVETSSAGATLVSPHAAASLSLPTATVVKLAGGVYYQRPEQPLLLDPVYGNPGLEPERALHGVLGVEQLLPIGALIRLEAWGKQLDNLVVNPDTPQAVARGVTYTNDGRGFAYGVDALVMYRGRRLGAGLAYGWLRSERVNPLNEVYVRRFQPLQQQTHTFGCAADVRADDWVLSARYQFHTSRPFTPIVGWRLAESEGEAAWVPIVGRQLPNGRRGLNDHYHRPFHELSLRVERWFRQPSWRVTVYAEVINVTNRIDTYVDSYDSGEPERGVLPRRGSFDTLPIRPFIGVRAEL